MQQSTLLCWEWCTCLQHNNGTGRTASQSARPALLLLECAFPTVASPPAPSHLPSLEHCCDVSSRGLLHLSAGLPLLRQLHLCGSGVSEGAVAQLRRTPRGKRVQIELYKACWWLPEGAAMA